MMLRRIGGAMAVWLVACGLLCASPPEKSPVEKSPAEKSQGVQRVVSLGDSITKGVRTGVKADETFSARLAATLNQDLPTVEVTNVGIGGERTDQALLRLDKDVLSLKPAVVLIMYGTNDSYVDKQATTSRITAEEYGDNLRQLVKRIREAGAKPVLMTEPRWGDKAGPNGIGEHPNVRLEQYVTVCREVARELKVPLVDHYRHWSEANAAGTDIGTWTTDQCHPNPAGHQVMTDTILTVLKDVLADS